jgi:hypothetical protein
MSLNLSLSCQCVLTYMPFGMAFAAEMECTYVSVRIVYPDTGVPPRYPLCYSGAPGVLRCGTRVIAREGCAMQSA